MYPYNINSSKAEEFINHQEIEATLAYAQANKSNRTLIEELITRAADCKGSWDVCGHANNGRDPLGSTALARPQ